MTSTTSAVIVTDAMVDEINAKLAEQGKKPRSKAQIVSQLRFKANSEAKRHGTEPVQVRANDAPEGATSKPAGKEKAKPKSTAKPATKPAAKKGKAKPARKVRKNRDGSTCATVEATTAKHGAEIYRMRHEDGRTWLAIAETLGLIPQNSKDTGDGKWGSVHVWNAYVAWCAANGETPVRSVARGQYAGRDDVVIKPRPGTGRKAQAWAPAYPEGAKLAQLRALEGGKVHWRNGTGDVASAPVGRVTSLRNGALNFYEAVDADTGKGAGKLRTVRVADLVKSA